MRAAFAELGDIRSTDILSGLVALWREGASGSLRFSRSGATAGFHLSAGEVTTVWSSEARFETASILLRAGKLDTATLERLSTPEGVDRALSALHAGVLTKREWRWGEKIRAVEVLSDLLTWIEGDYTFDRGAHSGAGEFRLTVPRLVLELFLRSRDRGLVLHYLGGADVPLARAPHFDSEFIAFGLTADAEAVVRLIDGKATAAQIAGEGPAEPFAVEKLLAALVTLGLVHPEFVAAEPRPQPRAEPVPEEEPDEESDEEEVEVEVEEFPAAAEEPGAGPEAFGELDVPEPFPSEEPRLEADLGEPPESALDEEESAIEASELAGEDSLEAERLRPSREDVAESPLERAAFGGFGGVGEADLSEAGPADLGEAPTPERESRPALDLATGIGSPDRPKRRSPGLFLWLLAILAAGVAVVILLRGGDATTHKAALGESPTPAVTASGEAAVLSAEVSPVATEAPPTPLAANVPIPTVQPTRPAVVPTQPPSRPTASAVKPTAPRARPTQPPLKPTLPATAPRAATAEREVPAANRQAWLDRAARDRQRADADRKSQYTIQLELACEVPTLVDAWKYDRPPGTLWVLTTPYDGQTCFRVLSGRYATKEAARRALSGVPAFFSTGGNRPVVTAIR